ncbi:exo-alpha-sialidase [Pseudactinotalea sp. Z1748]|uniref:exo-alpha-sialidase n=1 Tax=Pseudactinotalea sp. Z1748 TaxID=3413027 RepID=UPI003C7B94F0
MKLALGSAMALAMTASLFAPVQPDYYVHTTQMQETDPLIDLALMYDAGTLSVDTDMTFGEVERQRNVLDINGPYGVVRDAATPPEAHYRIDFDEPILVGATGVALKPGFPESAVVEVSVDGELWETVAAYDEVDTGRALDWTNLEEPIEISAFRVTITDSFGEWPVLENVGLSSEFVTDEETPSGGDVTVATASAGHGLWFPDIIRLKDGRLLAAFQEAETHYGPVGRIYVTTSSDGGFTWSDPQLVIDSEYDDRDPKMAQLSDGTVLLGFFQTDQSTSTTLGTHVVRSADGGQTWSEPVKVGTEMDWDASHGPITELSDGSVLMPLYGSVGDAPSQATVVRSTDGGRTWPAASEVVVAMNAPSEFIDLSAMYDAGTLSVDTDMTFGEVERQRNVLDINAPYGVVRDAATPPEAHYRIDFDEPILVGATGVALKPGFPESAVVEVSVDGELWETVAAYDEVDTGRALDWTNLEEPIEISAFRVTITDSFGEWPVLEKIGLAEESVTGENFDFQEPTLTALSDGEIVALLRTTTSPQLAYLSRSFDNGQTWTEAEPTDIPASSHHLLSLANGGVLVTYGDVSDRFSPNRATSGRIVEEPAGSWDGYHDIPLYDSGHSWDQANPSSAEVEPDLFLTLSFDVETASVVGVFSTRDDYLVAADPLKAAEALRDSLEGYLAAGDIDGPIAHQLSNTLDQVQRHLDGGRDNPASQAVERFMRHLDNPKRPDTLTDEAAADLREQAEQLQGLM